MRHANDHLITPSPIEDWTGRLTSHEQQILVKRDDLLPFPLPGNKFRKLTSELATIDPETSTIVTVGAVHSNHCRTTAFMCSKMGIHPHLILHDDGSDPLMFKVGIGILDRLGATYEIVESQDIESTIDASLERFSRQGPVHFIAGGCHTSAGVHAYEMAVHELAQQIESPPSAIFLASGTGATQAGIVLGTVKLGWTTEVIGISVAREATRGADAVAEALSWRCASGDITIRFSDAYRAGGYGKTDRRTLETVERAWNAGFPVDPVYTGKALVGLKDMVETGALERPGPIVFWHTGGLFQALLKDFSF